MLSKTRVQHHGTYWNEGGDVITYSGTALRMDTIPELL